MDSVSSLRAAVTPILGELSSPLRSSASKERIVSSPFLGCSTLRLVLVFLFIRCASPILALCRMQEGSQRMGPPTSATWRIFEAFQGRRAYARWPTLWHIGNLPSPWREAQTDATLDPGTSLHYH